MYGSSRCVLGSSLLSSSSSMLAVMSTTHDVSGLHWCFLKASSNIGLLLMVLDIALNKTRVNFVLETVPVIFSDVNDPEIELSLRNVASCCNDRLTPSI